uniref:(northern house mosquito) hypothetical protein n=1 Tax=Culex pipiens TaxID=7175 RepID=A0A8D8CDS6_CULPI
MPVGEPHRFRFDFVSLLRFTNHKCGSAAQESEALRNAARGPADPPDYEAGRETEQSSVQHDQGGGVQGAGTELSVDFAPAQGRPAQQLPGVLGGRKRGGIDRAPGP